MSLNPGVTVVKDPNANLVYTWDWSDWLVSPAQIASFTIIPQTFVGDATPLVSDNESKTNTTVIHRLTGGTAGKTYTVTVRIVTNETPAQTEDRSIKVTVRQQ